MAVTAFCFPFSGETVSEPRTDLLDLGIPDRRDCCCCRCGTGAGVPHRFAGTGTFEVPACFCGFLCPEATEDETGIFDFEFEGLTCFEAFAGTSTFLLGASAGGVNAPDFLRDDRTGIYKYQHIKSSNSELQL